MIEVFLKDGSTQRILDAKAATFGITKPLGLVRLWDLLLMSGIETGEVVAQFKASEVVKYIQHNDGEPDKEYVLHG